MCAIGFAEASCSSSWAAEKAKKAKRAKRAPSAPLGASGVSKPSAGLGEAPASTPHLASASSDRPLQATAAQLELSAHPAALVDGGSQQRFSGGGGGSCLGGGSYSNAAQGPAERKPAADRVPTDSLDPSSTFPPPRTDYGVTLYHEESRTSILLAPDKSNNILWTEAQEFFDCSELKVWGSRQPEILDAGYTVTNTFFDGVRLRVKKPSDIR